MPYTKKFLVLANRTAASDELLAALRAEQERCPARFTLLVPTPATSPAGEAAAALEAALDRMRGEGLQADGGIGFGNPVEVFQEHWDPRRFDEIIVATLPTHASRWLQIDVPHRVARIAGVPVHHVVATPRNLRAGEPLPPHARPGVLAPLTVLTWGHHGRQSRAS